MVDAICNLTVLELLKLIKALRVKFGLSTSVEDTNEVVEAKTVVEEPTEVVEESTKSEEEANEALREKNKDTDRLDRWIWR